MRVDFYKAIELLKQGNAIIFPTDTVFGIGVSSRVSPNTLFEIKKRSKDKPIPWLVGGFKDLALYGIKVPDYAMKLAKEYWPGALTLVLNASDKVPDFYRGENNTIAMRMPNSQLVLAMIEALGCPIATTSANMSGEPPVANIGDLKLSVSLPYVICEQDMNNSGLSSCKPGILPNPSTIILCTGDEPVVLRGRL